VTSPVDGKLKNNYRVGLSSYQSAQGIKVVKSAQGIKVVKSAQGGKVVSGSFSSECQMPNGQAELNVRASCQADRQAYQCQASCQIELKSIAKRVTEVSCICKQVGKAIS
jgi:hypothetical protein